jgi:uncharacterized membrane protein YkvA (DUF1232 family)
MQLRNYLKERPLIRLRRYAANLRSETYALYLAYRDPRTPWYARLAILSVVGYALSPIDLIPDFIPVLGLVDDLLILPLAIVLTIKLIPAAVLEASREQARMAPIKNPLSGRAAWLAPAAAGTLLILLFVLLIAVL